MRRRIVRWFKRRRFLDAHAAAGCCDANQKPIAHDTSRIAWARLLERVGEEFPMQCPGCSGDVRLIAFTRLTEREREILEHLSRCYSNREIADTFANSVPTVRSHLRSIYAKLHVRSRTQAALKYHRRQAAALVFLTRPRSVAA
jgi:DNA-binding NarL/FixJ family response regulator